MSRQATFFDYPLLSSVLNSALPCQAFLVRIFTWQASCLKQILHQEVLSNLPSLRLQKHSDHFILFRGQKLVEAQAKHLVLLWIILGLLSLCASSRSVDVSSVQSNR